MPPGVSRLPAVVFERQAVLAVVVVEVAQPRPRPQPPELSLAVPEEAFVVFPFLAVHFLV